ncbi:MAG: hypothetical protein HKN63_00820 [Rhodobacteraceae bacterium]|nr:hypothetical protein [Paracoccaceae bacterium]
MNAERRIDEATSQIAPVQAGYLNSGLEGLSAFAGKLKMLDEALIDLAEIGDEVTSKGVRRLRQQVAAAEPSITMIGQVKAGKTSLVNAIIGLPDLLPADVNPWTSVVTSLHLSPSGFASDKRASFKFFDGEDWDRLLSRGGRIGELANRAGADDELEKIHNQLAEMREKSRKRLGRKFELLLGQTHDYGYFDEDLIERYVCLGDDFELERDTSNTQGRFADITQSADIFIERPDLPMPLCIRDTPGVNDTFMMREQITIRAIRESRTCVVVLSAHQALSDVDMALIRLISNVKSRDVVIFVNRIDELADPATQVPEIEASIRNTLADHQGPADAEIIFGSAYWANNVLVGQLSTMAGASTSSLLNWAEHDLKDTKIDTPQEMIWECSGIPKLFRALAARIEENTGREVIGKSVRAASNLLNGLRASSQILDMRDGLSLLPDFDRTALFEEFDRVEAECLEDLAQRFAKVEADFEKRLDRSHKGFLDRATASLIKHLESFGEGTVWKYDPSGLRVLLRSTYRVFGNNARKTMEDSFAATAERMVDVYLRAFAVPAEDVKIEPPVAPSVPPPVLLGQTIALDLMSGWWKRWWFRRRGYRSYAVDFAEMIKAETDPIVAGLKTDHAQVVSKLAADAVKEFLESQRQILMGLADSADGDAAALKKVVGGANDPRRRGIEDTLFDLGRYAEPEELRAIA